MKSIINLSIHTHNFCACMLVYLAVSDRRIVVHYAPGLLLYRISYSQVINS